MKGSIIAITIAAAVAPALAQSIADLPTCAQTCGISNISKSACGISDPACLCKDEAYTTAFTACITESCSAADQASTLEVSKSLCPDNVAAATTEDTSAEEETPAEEEEPAAEDAEAETTESATAEEAEDSTTSTEEPTATASAYVVAAATPSSTTTTATAHMSTGTGSAAAAANGTQSGYNGALPSQYAGGADALRAGQWMGFFALLGLVAL